MSVGLRGREGEIRSEENLRKNRWLVVESCGGVAMGKDGWEARDEGMEERKDRSLV